MKVIIDLVEDQEPPKRVKKEKKEMMELTERTANGDEISIVLHEILFCP